MARACMLISSGCDVFEIGGNTNESVGRQARQHLHPTISQKHCIHTCTHVNGLIESTFLSGNARESADSAKKSTPTIHDRMITCLVDALTYFLSIMGFTFESATTHVAFLPIPKRKLKESRPHNGVLSSRVSVQSSLLSLSTNVQKKTSTTTMYRTPSQITHQNTRPLYHTLAS
jgi:hypothetical protein